jgi:hypothetical protein
MDDAGGLICFPDWLELEVLLNFRVVFRANTELEINSWLLTTHSAILPLISTARALAREVAP